MKDWKCDCVCPKETKLEEVLPFDMRSLWGFYVDCAVLKAVGPSGPGGPCYVGQEHVPIDFLVLHSSGDR